MNTNMQTITDSFAAYLYISGASPATIRHRTQTVKRLCAAGLNPLDCSASDLIRWLARFPSPATRHSYRSALRTFYTWAVMFSQVDKDPTVMIPKVKVPRTMPRPVSDRTLARLLDLATGETRAVVSLMAYCGLRGAEACNVRAGDFYRSGDVWRLRVTKPKGGGTQTVPVPSWLVERTQCHFPIVASYETMIHRISYLLASIEPGSTPHSLRHWYATTALNQSGNVRIVQELLRHKSLSSTQIYTQVTNSDASAVAEELPHIDGLM